MVYTAERGWIAAVLSHHVKFAMPIPVLRIHCSFHLDGLHGFEMAERGVSSVRFETDARLCRLPAGEKQVIGWLRLGEDREVQVEISKP